MWLRVLPLSGGIEVVEEGGRTGVVVGCYMVRHNMAVGQAALERIELLRKDDGASYMNSPQTEAQRQMVREWVPGE